MQIRGLIPTVMVVAAATAIGASTALAAALEVKNEKAAGVHCPAVTLSGTDVDGGCLIHAKSENFGRGAGVEFRKHVFGIESHITRCDFEFWGRVDEDATGYGFEQQLSGANCTRKACDEESESIQWVAVAGEIAPQTETMTMGFCFENSFNDEGDESCEVDLPFKNNPATDHRTELGSALAVEFSGHGVSGFRCELAGHWNSEASGTVSHDGQLPTNLTVNHL
jgi:hypothetical protein